jgi:hypothetical protein
MPETADRIESIFAAAVALLPEERESYLARNAPATQSCASGSWLCSKPMIAPDT